MAEPKDPKIKLFGKTIELPETSTDAAADNSGAGSAQSCDAAGENSSLQDPPSSSSSMLEDRSLNRDTDEQESHKDKDISDKKQDDSKKEDRARPLMSEELKDSEVSRPTSENSQQPFYWYRCCGRKNLKG
ncbi:Dof-type domain-containing protein [Abeliophyllum distichum]|uniref:Dof-type domain-containing protein n=1 Tax=Abeliophyllum distichum TaxID=126358 RepID=A0ABD1SGR4_9LAMI